MELQRNDTPEGMLKTEEEEKKFYPRIEKQDLKYCDPMQLGKGQLKDLTIQIDAASLARIRSNVDLDSPYTSQAIKELGLHEEDIVLKEREDFNVPNEDIEIREKRYTIYLLQLAGFHQKLKKIELRKKLIIGRNKLKHQQENSKRKNKIPPLTNTNLLQFSIQSPYKSPTELIEHWIDEKSILSTKYRERYETMKKVLQRLFIFQNEVIEFIRSQDEFLIQEKRIQSEIEKREELKSRHQEAKQKKAQNFNQRTEQVREKKNHQIENQMQQIMKIRSDYSLKQSLIGESFRKQQFQDSLNVHDRSISKQHKYDEVLLKKSQILQQQNSRVDLKEVYQKLENSQQARKRYLDLKQKQMSESTSQLPQIQQAGAELKEQKLTKHLSGFLNKFDKFLGVTERHKKMSESVIQKKKEIEAIHQDQIQRKLLSYEEKQEKRTLKIQLQLEQEEGQVVDCEDKKYEKLLIKIDEKKKKIEKARLLNGSFKQSYQKKYEEILEKQIIKQENNKLALKKREGAIEKMKYERAQSLNQIRLYSQDLVKVRQEMRREERAKRIMAEKEALKQKQQQQQQIQSP